MTASKYQPKIHSVLHPPAWAFFLAVGSLYLILTWLVVWLILGNETIGRSAVLPGVVLAAIGTIAGVGQLIWGVKLLGQEKKGRLAHGSF